MGRNSKDDNDTNETSEFQRQSATTTFPNRNAAQTSEERALSESESMARDIKEGRLSGFVGSGTVLTGETNFTSMLRVDGHLTGKVSSEEGTLIIGSGGQVDADVDVASALINGTVNGDVITSEKLEMGRTAKVVGNIRTPRLLMADGAVLEGNCSMLSSKESLDQRQDEDRERFATNTLSYGENGTSDEADEDEEDETETSSPYLSTASTAAEEEEEDEDTVTATAN